MRFKDELKKYFVYRFGGFICALFAGVHWILRRTYLQATANKEAVYLCLSFYSISMVMGIILFMTSAVPPKSWAIPGSFEMFLLMTLWTFLLLWKMDKWLD